MTLTYADVQAKKTRRTITHPVVTDDDAVQLYRIAVKNRDDARNRRVPLKELTPLQRAAEQAEAAVRASTLLFRVRALPPGEYAALKAEHPPTDADNDAAREATGNPATFAEFHPDSFGPALVAACLLEPQVTVDQAEGWRKDWNEAEWAGLVNAAIYCNQQATPTGGLVFS